MTDDRSRREGFKERWQRVAHRGRRAFAHLGKRGWRVVTGFVLMVGLSVIVWSALGGGGWTPVPRADGRPGASPAGVSAGADDGPGQERPASVGARVEVVEERPVVPSPLPWENSVDGIPVAVGTPAAGTPTATGAPVAAGSDGIDRDRDDSGTDVTAAADRAVQAVEAPIVQADVRTMTRPGQGALVREPGWYRHPIYADWRYYPGVEIQMEPGSPVYAVLPGVVVFVGEHDRWGLTVRIDHGSGWESTYGQLAVVHVERGDRVAAGETVGTAGLSVAGEPHLYFSLARNGSSVDPGRYLDL